MRFTIVLLLMKQTSAYWDEATTTEMAIRTDITPRQSFFRWQEIEFWNPFNYFWWWDWVEIGRRRALCVVAGVSHELLPITTGAILNRRTVITSSNAMDPFMDRQSEIRIWALGRGGSHITPYRYKVWKIRRVLPKSNNPEHWHGIRGIHQPRHDVVVILSKDQIALAHYWPRRYHYAYKATLSRKFLEKTMFFAGSGFEYLQHIAENYKIFHAPTSVDDVVDCSYYLPKWWGKFICLKNIKSFPGLQSGGGLFTYDEGPHLLGVGCFEIRYNEDRILVFTDLRYYYDIIHTIASIHPGDYYEYAYPEYAMSYGWVYDSTYNTPKIPWFNIKEGLFPLG